MTLPPAHFFRLFLWFLSFLWLGLYLSLLFVVDPQVIAHVGWKNSYLPFFVLLLLTVGWPLGLIRHHLGKGLLWGLALSLYLYLRSAGLGVWWNGVLLLALLVLLELYWRFGDTKSK